MNKSRKPYVLLTVISMIMVTLIIAAATVAQRSQFDPHARGPAVVAPNQNQPVSDMTIAGDNQLSQTSCRYGVGNIMRKSLPWVQTLEAGWYLNFTTGNPGALNAEFVPVVSVKQNFDDQTGERLPSVTFRPPLAYTVKEDNGFIHEGLGKLLSQHPGQLVLVGNEVDVDNSTQGNTMPEIYARAYHEAYQYIKAVDPTAKVAIAGLSMMTEGRLQYLEIVWDTYKRLYGTEMPVDVWNMHLYILQERASTNPDYPDADPVYGDGKIALGTDPALAKLSSHDNAALCPDPSLPDTPENDPREDVYCRSEHDSVRIFKEQVYNMRNWMKAHGQQNKPLIITEFGLLYPYLTFPDGSCDFLRDESGQCFTPSRVTSYMDDTLAFLETAADPNLGYSKDGDRLVQQWLWYSVAAQPHWSGGSSNLVACNFDGSDCNFDGFTPGAEAALTQMGQNFKQAARSQTTTTNLVAGTAANINAHLDFPGNTATATLSALFRNDGTGSIVEPFKVTFYSDAALSKVIGSFNVVPDSTGAIAGCTWEERFSEHATLTWSGLAVGTHSYWAKVDSQGAISETDENDNVTTQGSVTVYPSSTFVPVVNRNK